MKTYLLYKLEDNGEYKFQYPETTDDFETIKWEIEWRRYQLPSEKIQVRDAQTNEIVY